MLFANFAEAMAEGRGKAQADALRRARHEVSAKKFADSLPSPFGERAEAADVRDCIASAAPDLSQRSPIDR